MSGRPHSYGKARVTKVTSHLLGSLTSLYFRVKIEHELRSTFGCVAARLLVLCADYFFDDSHRETMLGGLGDSGSQQPDHLCHRFKNRATGLNSGEPVLYCPLCGQPSNMAQGRVLLSRAARPFAVTRQAGNHEGFPHLNHLLSRFAKHSRDTVRRYYLPISHAQPRLNCFQTSHYTL